ncbi:MAG TPA: Hsp20/alpha crystallin family protein [Planctomycetaceae bacterium]|jgi:HSP20 family protein|nr:Hsp20/alpha crystallin family protein [Planctomycetaceae bacterium]
MRIRELIPWRNPESEHELSRRGNTGDPFAAFETQMRRYFDDFFDGFDLGPFGKWSGGAEGGRPKVDIAETSDAVHVTADLPGLAENEIDVTLTDGHLVIRGEKRSEKEEQDETKNYHRIERSYGSFHRSIALPAEVDDQKVDASFKNGVLTVVLPKVATASTGKKIEVKKAP